MTNEEKIKNIVAVFLKITPEAIDQDTSIGIQAVGGSIILHRMYAKLSEAGFNVSGVRRKIETFGQLIDRRGNKNEELPAPSPATRPQTSITPTDSPSSIRSVGIDMEKVSQFESQEDYRDATFYKENFSPEEIAYCILQAKPLESFAGRFAAKEAIAKADNTWRDVAFNQISITCDANGKPRFPGFHISISHTDSDAIAIAIQI